MCNNTGMETATLIDRYTVGSVTYSKGNDRGTIYAKVANSSDPWRDAAYVRQTLEEDGFYVYRDTVKGDVVTVKFEGLQRDWLR